MSRPLKVLLLALTFLIVTGGSASARPGDLDLGFGASNGLTVSGSPPRIAASSPHAGLVALDDGSTIELHSTGRTQLVRRHADGTLDTGFGDGGYLTLPVRNRRAEQSQALLRAGDQTILLTSGSKDRQNDLYLRLVDNQTGAVDPDFGSGGVATVSLSAIFPGQNQGVESVGLELDNQGRIYVGAAVYDPYRNVLFRLAPEGRIDRSFGTSGFVVELAAPCGGIQSMNFVPQGILVAHFDCLTRYTFDGQPDPAFENEPLEIDSDSIYETLVSDAGAIYIRLYRGGTSKIRKINADGSIDTGFGTGGSLDTAQPGISILDISLDGSGRILVLGTTTPDSSAFAIARYTPEGNHDPTLAGGGVAEIELDPGEPERLLWTVESPLGLIAFGVVGDFLVDDRLVMFRLLDDMSVDASFGDGGIVEPSASVFDSDGISDLAVTADGKTVAGGKLGSKALVIRYSKNGKIDQSFGDQGRLTLNSPASEGTYEAQRVIPVGGGRVAVCLGTGFSVQVVLIDRDGRIDESFGDDGKAQVQLQSCSGIASLKSGRLLVSGPDSRRRAVVVRLKSDGADDSGYGAGGRAVGPADSVPFDRKFTFAALADGSSLVATGSTITKFDPAGQRDRAFGSEKGSVNLLNRKKEPLVTDPGVLAVAPQGGIFLAGNDGRQMEVAKFTIEGKPARRFGDKGVLRILHPDLMTPVRDLKFDRAGRPVIAASGQIWCRGNRECLEQIRVYRFTRTGLRDKTFGRNGVATLNPDGIISTANSLELTASGYLLGGYAETQQGGPDTLLLRLKR